MQGKPTRVVRVDEFVGRRRDVGEDPEPGVRVAALGDGEVRHGRSAHTVEAVAPGDRIATQLALDAGGIPIADERPVARHIVDAERLCVEFDRSATVQACGDQILHDLGLRPDGHGAAGEVDEVDMVALAGELEIDATVLEPVAVHPGAESDLAQ